MTKTNRKKEIAKGFMVYASQSQKDELKRRAVKSGNSLSSYLVRIGLGLPLEKYSVNLKSLINSIPEKQ